MKKKRISALVLTLTLLCGLLPQTARAATIDISAYWGAAATTHAYTISTSGTVDLTALSGTDAGKLTLTVNNGAEVEFTGNASTTYTNLSIRIAGGAKVTLDNVSIDNTGWGASPIVAGDNNTGNTLCFKGTNTLTTQEYCFAAVGVYNSTCLIITGISGGILNANGVNSGAGIGGGSGDSNDHGCGTVTISGGTVNAKGRAGSAGIGGGDGGSGGTVMVTGGTVNATSVGGGSGIGSGGYTSGGKVTITGGTVNATSVYGAGIGSGSGSSGGTVTITGGTVTATSTNAAGIGNGAGGSSCTSYFSGGSINASSVSGTPTISSGNSTQVYLTTVTLPSGTAVSALSIKQGGNDYLYGAIGMQADSNKKLYLYLPAGSTTADITTDEAYTGYYGTVATSGANVLKMDQAALSISGVNASYTYGDTISPSASGGSGTGAISYYYTGTGGTSYSGAAAPTALGSYTVTATKAADASYYSASASAGFIVQKDISVATVADIAAQTYTGSQLTPSVTVADDAKTLVKDTDYTVTYGANINAGTDTGAVTVTGKGNYVGSVTKNFTINAKTGFTVADIVAQTYTGSQLTLSVTVTDGAKTLVKDTDYTVTYGANVNAGTDTGSVTVTGKGNYMGSVTKNFTIKEAASSGGSTAAQYQATVGSDKNAVTISGQGSSASVTVTSAQIAGGTTVTMPEIPGVTSYQVVLPAAALNGSQTGSGFVIKTSAATLTAPADMLSGINGTKAQLSIGTVSASELSGAAKAAVGGHPVVSLSLTVDGKTVTWNNPKAAVTVSIPYKPTAEELAHSESIVIWYIDDSGNVFTIPSGHYDKTTGTVTFNTTHFSDYAVAYRKVSFTDVNDTAWYSSAVDFLAARGITSGTTAKTFSPDATLTRGQFITMLLRAYSITADTNLTNNFSDAGNTYYTGYLASAKRLGITSGVGDNKFAPDAAITRQEMFTLLYNALKVLGNLPSSTSGKALSDFTDAGSIASWATDAMTALVKAGTVSGSGDKLNPSGTTTRAEMAQVLYNLLGK